jgi:uncharacterized protein YkwD
MLFAGVLLIVAVAAALLTPTLREVRPQVDPRAGAPLSTELTPSAVPAPVDAPTSTRPPVTTPTTKPSPSLAKTTTSSRPASGLAALENRVLELANAERAQQDCPALRLDTRLRTAARGYSEEMFRYGAWNHIGHDGSDPGERMRRAGYDTSGGWAENIAKGYPTPEAVMKAWMNSTGHRKNILNCDLRALGVGVVRGDGRLYWTQDFGAR